MSPRSRDGVDAEVSLIVYEEDYVDDHGDRASYRVAEDFGVFLQFEILYFFVRKPLRKDFET